MTASPSPAAAQLRRLLHIIPRLADGEAHPLSQVATLAGVHDMKQVIVDLSSLVDRFDAPGGISIGGFSDGMQVCIDDQTVSVFANHFLRPMRLTMRELCALELGLAILRSECPPEEHAAIDRARQRLRDVVTVLTENEAHEGVWDASVSVLGDRAVLATLRRAQRERHTVSIVYRGSEATTATPRIVCPYGIVFASGRCYVVAHCQQSEALRFFRLDRIERVDITSTPFTIPDEFNLATAAPGARMLGGHPITWMRVRYSPAIARWIAEREGATLNADGSLTLDHPVHDSGWAVRHVLQYGPEAEVLAPPELRALVIERVRTIAQAMAQEIALPSTHTTS